MTFVRTLKLPYLVEGKFLLAVVLVFEIEEVLRCVLPKEMLRLGSLLVLGFSMAHSPNLQGILTSVGNFVDLAGHFTNAS